MDKKIAIVTGANSGIGYETAKAFAWADVTVVLACRDLSKGKEAQGSIRGTTGNEEVHLLPLDLASFASIRAFCGEFGQRYDRLDILVNNAGTFRMDVDETEDGFETTMGVNYFGTFLLTNLLLPFLERSAEGRIVNVSSDAYRMGKLDVDDIDTRRTAGMKAYGASKLALMMFTLELARRLEGRTATVNAVHPGQVKTGIWNFDKWYAPVVRLFAGIGAVSAAEGAEPVVHLALSDDVRGQSGRYFDRLEEKGIVNVSIDEQQRLWEKSVEIVGLDSGASE
jgi:NAD(P)-dependent dehydrogenase (short-subunit alcohol dehydrogenase family)